MLKFLGFTDGDSRSGTRWITALIVPALAIIAYMIWTGAIH